MARTKLDPDGYYVRLGLEPEATRTVVVAAFRAKARLLHPDVPRTGDAAAFVAVKQAYDVLSNPARRGAYDRKAREAAAQADVVQIRPAPYAAAPLARHPRFSDLPVVAWVGLGAFLSLCVYQATSHLLAPSRIVTADIRPNAASVAPLSASAHQAVLYGPAPVRLAGAPNFYVLPTATPTVLWHFDVVSNALAATGRLPPFSSVQAVRLVRQNGMLEVLVNDQGNGFISADHLAPGDAIAARVAYCRYNAGPAPFHGELLERQGVGTAKLAIQNQAVQPAVVKLRDEAGTVAVAVYLGPGGHVDLEGLPKGAYRPEYAIGELWSRACGVFAAGMRARRMDRALQLPSESPLVLTPDGAAPPASDISDQAFGRN